jgi:hypothetical protein
MNFTYKKISLGQSPQAAMPGGHLPFPLSRDGLA